MKMYRRKGSHSFRLPNGDYQILLSGHDSEKIELEGIVAMIWDKLQRGVTADEISEWLSDEHDLPLPTAKKEGKKILGHLKKNGLIEEEK